MTRDEAFAEINKIQDDYIDELITLMNSPDYSSMKTINFTSPTGTGKTKMMSKLINALPDYYFIITSLSKGQLHLQIRQNLEKDCKKNNFYVYGSADYKINSKLEADDIIGKIPPNTKCIWLRDEGHIKTNRFDELLMDVCYKVVNFSATNTYSNIKCNFAQTMMLRTVNQDNGTPEDAIAKLLEVKAAHAGVSGYNPCAIFRCIGNKSDEIYERIVNACEENSLSYIDITDDAYVMAELCEDDNEYDVIINKFKIVEGIDIRRAHVLYMDNQPQNDATTIQVIGRCRRNALLYRNDIDILAPENKELLEKTRECYVFYNVEKMKISTDESGELQYAFCNHISCELLKSGTSVDVINGQLSNGLYVIELAGLTGRFDIIKDSNTGFNIVNPMTEFYDEKIMKIDNNYIYCCGKKIHKDNLLKLVKHLKPIDVEWVFDYSVGERVKKKVEPYYRLDTYTIKNAIGNYDFLTCRERVFTQEYLESCLQSLKNVCIDKIISEVDYDILEIRKEVDEFLSILKIENIDLYKYLKSLHKTKFRMHGVKINGEKILSDICSDNELYILQYFCIKKSMDGECLKDIKKYVTNYISNLTRHYEFINVNHEKVTYILLNRNIDKLRIFFEIDIFPKICYPSDLILYPEDIEKFFVNLKLQLDTIANSPNNLFIRFDALVDSILKHVKAIFSGLSGDVISVRYSFDSLFEELSEEEKHLKENDYIKFITSISQKDIDNMKYYKPYTKIVNDRESAIVGVDLMKQIKLSNGNVIWTETSSVSSKIDSYNKFNSFISKSYSKELIQAKSQLIRGKNNFNLPTNCNSLIGYCVEYYSKYLVYGSSYLGRFIEDAQKESKTTIVNDGIIIRACMLKYREMMVRSFGTGVSRLIKSISANMLIQREYGNFVKLVIELGSKTADYVKNTLYQNIPAVDNIDPNLSINHIAGLADYITEDTILDVKVRNNIDEKCVRQVLAYHYLSTKRSDLHIKRVIVYDAVSDKAVVIDISPDKIK